MDLHSRMMIQQGRGVYNFDDFTEYIPKRARGPMVVATVLWLVVLLVLGVVIWSIVKEGVDADKDGGK